VDNSGSGNAMTEIALALAMAFFSIMVLTMISMRVGNGQVSTANVAVLAQSISGSQSGAKIAPDRNDVVLIHYRGVFLNKNMTKTDPGSLNGSQRVILALDPALPLDEAISVRARLNHPNLIVSTLDKKWLEALRRKYHESP
jgi:hypothetical protein